MLWTYLLHLGYNLWAENHPHYSDELICEDEAWSQITEHAATAGVNAIVVDLADGVRYDSHPEIAVHGAWSTARLKDELDRLRHLGLQPIPKLNFSACHDLWLKQYSRMVSTETYYRICSELIAEVAELFDQPTLFHLGMDEELAEYQPTHQHVVVRQHDLWWHDLQFLINAVEETGSRPWIWSDTIWTQRDEFHKNMPRNIMQSNWYYRSADTFTIPEGPRPTLIPRGNQGHLAYLDLAEHGFEQIPCGSNYLHANNFPATVEFAINNIPRNQIRGFLMAPWHPTTTTYAEQHREAIRILGDARELIDEPHLDT